MNAFIAMTVQASYKIKYQQGNFIKPKRNLSAKPLSQREQQVSRSIWL